MVRLNTYLKLLRIIADYESTLDFNNFTEEQLVNFAQNHPDDKMASQAMGVLKRKFDNTYIYCMECDGLVCKVKQCCLNQPPVNTDQINETIL
jgi:hypothetical protein